MIVEFKYLSGQVSVGRDLEISSCSACYCAANFDMGGRVRTRKSVCLTFDALYMAIVYLMAYNPHLYYCFYSLFNTSPLYDIIYRNTLQQKWRIPAAAAKSLQSCPTLCDPIDGSLPGSSVLGILQARTLEWVAISFSNAGK